MAQPESDELARTATAIGGSAPGRDGTGLADGVGATLGRYCLERELGAGGMGVVHAAFDPDLERRVALKVLRAASDGTDARARLLREARAMARLTHPNVVTVYEVGSVAGRDFVAMELIDGDSLAEWMRATPRSRRDLLDAFIAAGHGLAAAHGAGLIHRDFKPHNVLRSRDGRICVTDFGLARAAELPEPRRGESGGREIDALATTLELPPPATTAASSMSGLTQTGSVLGTPAYMAPEQWAGTAVGPAADQFAFCVALWEALAGERPYRGDTLESLRTAVERGPGALDNARMPRAVRAILRRGLDPDPARRWPTMAALLAALARARRSRRVELLSVIGALAIAGIAAFVVLGGGHAAAPVAKPALCSASEVWPAATRAAVQAAHDDVVGIVDRDVRVWAAQRDRVCTAVAPATAQVACLDGVRARQAAVIGAVVGARGAVDASTVAADLVEPEMCALATPPHLTLIPSADVIAAFGLGLDRHDLDDHPDLGALDALIARADLEPCARAIASMTRAQLGTGPARHTAAADAVEHADRCGDDRVRADALLTAASFDLGSPMIGPTGEAALRRAAAAVERIPQGDLTAALDAMRSDVADRQAKFDTAIELADRASAGLGARGRVRDQLGAVLDGLDARLRRASPADLAAASLAVDTWKPIAARLGETHSFKSLVRVAATIAFIHGDIVSWHATNSELFEPPAVPVPEQRAITGVVVDPAGHPVAGATVYAGTYLSSDSVGLGDEGIPGNLARATSDAQGRFSLVASRTWTVPVIQAESGALRSIAMNLTDHPRVVVAPTVRVTGRVELGGRVPAQLRVMLRVADTGAASTGEVAPVAADGSFAVDRVPPGNYLIGLYGFSTEVAGGDATPLTVRPPGVSGVVLALSKATRTVDIVVRSAVNAPLEGVQVVLVPGVIRATTVTELQNAHATSMRVVFARPVNDAAAPEVVRTLIRAGDLLAHFDTVPAGTITACALAVGGDFTDREFVRRLEAQIAKLSVQCQPLPADAKAAVVEASPMRRLDP